MNRITVIYAKGGLLDKYLKTLEVAVSTQKLLGYLPTSLAQELEDLENKIKNA